MKNTLGLSEATWLITLDIRLAVLRFEVPFTYQLLLSAW